MFIELTDHLRCPEDHAEHFLVLLPDQMEGRRVLVGQLGCPACGRTWDIVDGAMDFGGGEAATLPTALSAEAVHALLGVDGPGGYVGLVGAVAALAGPLHELLPGVGLVAVNPPLECVEREGISVLRASRFPLKAACLRGVILDRCAGQDPAWLEPSAAGVLPGLRVVGEGASLGVEAIGGLTLLAETRGCWVAQRGR